MINLCDQHSAELREINGKIDTLLFYFTGTEETEGLFEWKRKIDKTRATVSRVFWIMVGTALTIIVTLFTYEIIQRLKT